MAYVERSYLTEQFENLLHDDNVMNPVMKVLDALEIIDTAPTANVEEVKHGEWIYKHRHRGGFERRTAYDKFNNPHTVTLDNRYECEEPYCSVCGKLGGDFLNYCGNCGAKMDGRIDK